MSEKLKLDEYKEISRKLSESIFEEFKRSDDSSVFEVTLKYRDDSDMLGYGSFTKVFKSFSSVEDYILEARTFLQDDFNSEPIENRMYWQVTSYVMGDKDLEENIVCCFTVDMHLLNVNLLLADYNTVSRDGKSDEVKEIQSNHAFLSRPQSIDVPFESGDIIRVNAMPFYKPFFAMYLGTVEDSLRTRHFCVYYSYERNGLWIDDLSDACFADFFLLGNSPLTLCETVSECQDVKIMMAKHLLINNPDLWYDWLCAKEQINDDESSLDSVVLG